MHGEVVGAGLARVLESTLAIQKRSLTCGTLFSIEGRLL
jgi:hypothetical protein